MQDFIDLTFIIPCYGRQEKLVRALGSILSQDLQPSEVIIVDDASPEPLTIPEVFAASGRVRVIRNPVNAGPGKGRNTGMEAAHTNWVSFLDSDDCLLPGSLRQRWLYLESEEGQRPVKGQTIYGCGWKDVLPNGTILRERIPFAPERPADFFRGCWFCPGSCIIFNQNEVRRAAGTVDESLRRLEDYEWFVRIGLAGFKLKVQPQVGVAIERGSNTTLAAVTTATQIINQRIAALTSDRQLQRIAEAYLLYERAGSAWREKHFFTFGALMTRSLIALPRLSLSTAPGWRLRPHKNAE
jgi:glycosyltransferase involved in cell wall biosynthesis